MKQWLPASGAISLILIFSTRQTHHIIINNIPIVLNAIKIQQNCNKGNRLEQGLWIPINPLLPAGNLLWVCWGLPVHSSPMNASKSFDKNSPLSWEGINLRLTCPTSMTINFPKWRQGVFPVDNWYLFHLFWHVKHAIYTHYLIRSILVPG